MRLSIYLLVVCLLLGSTLVGCERHPRRDRKARAGVAQVSSGLASAVSVTTALSASQDQLRADLEALKTTHEADMVSLRGEIKGLRDQLDALTQVVADSNDKCDRLATLLAGVERDRDTIVLTGLNLRVQDAGPGQPPAPGLGNILVGPDDTERFKQHFRRDPIRTGTNNVVIGGANEYQGSGGLCVGVLNLLNGDYSVVFICENEVKSTFGSVLGGTNNLSQGRFGTVGGGLNRVVTGQHDFRAGHLFSGQ